MKTFVTFVLCSGLTGPFASNDICEGGILLTLFNSGTVPFIGKRFSYFDGLESLVYPFVRIAKATVVIICLFEIEFWILHLIETVRCDLCHPLFEGFGLLGWDGLDDAEESWLVGCICGVQLSIGREHFQLLTICKRMVGSFLAETALENRPICAGTFCIGLVGKYGYNIDY